VLLAEHTSGAREGKGREALRRRKQRGWVDRSGVVE